MARAPSQRTSVPYLCAHLTASTTVEQCTAAGRTDQSAARRPELLALGEGAGGHHKPCHQRLATARRATTSLSVTSMPPGAQLAALPDASSRHRMSMATKVLYLERRRRRYGFGRPVPASSAFFLSSASPCRDVGAAMLPRLPRRVAAPSNGSLGQHHTTSSRQTRSGKGKQRGDKTTAHGGRGKVCKTEEPRAAAAAVPRHIGDLTAGVPLGHLWEGVEERRTWEGHRWQQAVQRQVAASPRPPRQWTPVGWRSVWRRQALVGTPHDHGT